MTKLIAWIIVIIVVVFGAWELYAHFTPASSPVSAQPIAEAMYQCNDNKTIDATYYAGTSTPSTNPNTPPTPGGSVKVSLSDGRSFTLPQTVSADGARYSNGDPNVQGSETFVFWSKGNGALVLENNQDQTYTGCIEIAKDPGGLPQVYESGQNGFSMRYPSGYSVDEAYKYQEMGPGKSISGVKFTIDPSVATGTNLSSDSYFSVEQIPQTQNCSARLFLDLANGGSVSTTTDNGVDYSVASSTGAGAGNRYEEWVYAIPGTNPCVGIRYFVHYGVLQNYPAGSVKEFDQASLLNTFDSMRRTLILNQ
jgi:membrane-bound inhibitor of C-type lysozyme